jgi:hypothetical protein
LDAPPEITPLRKLHREVEAACVLADLMDTDDMRVFESCCGARLGSQAFGEPLL